MKTPSEVSSSRSTSVPASQSVPANQSGSASQSGSATPSVSATPKLLASAAQLPRRPLGVALGLVLLIGATLGLSDVLQRRLSQRLIDRLLISQKLRIQDNVDRFDATLRHAEASAQRFADLISSERHPLGQPESAAIWKREFEASFQRGADGSWRVPRARFDPQRDANAWIPPSVPLTPENRSFYLRSLEITRTFGLGALSDLLVNTWMLPLSSGMTAFWPSKPNYLYNASSSLDYRRTPWLTLTDPRVNPKHQPRWVGPEYDPAAQDWTISVVAPIFRHGQWAGSVGHNLLVSKLLGKLFDGRGSTQDSLSRPLFVANEAGHLLAQRDRSPRRDERVPPRYLPLLAGNGLDQGLHVVPDGLNYLVVAPIPTLKAKALYVVDGSWLRRSVQKELVGLQMGEGLFVLLAVGSVIGLAISDAQARQSQQQLLKQSNKDLVQQARLDQLTTLPNRLGLIEAANRALERAHRTGSDLLVVFLDLDRFKTINDSLGHGTGDALLEQVAQRLRQTVRSTDTVARLGGDEFVLVIEDLDDQFDAGHVAEKLHQAFRQPLLLDGVAMPITPSIGISIYPEDGQDIDTLMRQADMAMYAVKARGRNGWLFFTDAMNRAVQERLSLERDIRHGLEQGEFRLAYQPQWTIDGQELTGWEALLRWHQPQRGLLGPDAFLSVAEDTGMIAEIGALVLNQACQEAMRWQQSGFGHFGISVNLSARQFALGDLQQHVESALRQSGLQPSLLELEITESVLMADPDRAKDLLTHFKAQGIRVAIDDFGTGYSSLDYLSRFPIDRLKIDRSFVGSCLTDPNGAAIVEAVISLARSLGLSAIAEGVESEEQRHFLRHHGCDQIQGYLLGRPMAPEAIAGFLHVHSQKQRLATSPLHS